MNAELLRAKWEKLSSFNVMNGYKSIRITSDCMSDIFLGIDVNGNHSLILDLPEKHGVQFQAVKKEKISIELFNDTNYLIMTLIDEEYNSLFDDLIISLFNAIKNIEEVEIYSKVFIQTFYKWILFFTSNDKERIPKDLIKGLWGELIVLKGLVENSNSFDINRILSGWTGPYDQVHDFIYDDMNIEVKTKDIRKPTVRLSSEHQLEVEPGKKLVLSVVSINEDLMNGSSLKDLVKDIKTLTFNALGDFSIVLKALLKKGITLQNIHEYDNYRFKPLILQNYDCLAEGFPKVISAQLPSCINNVKYDLNLTNLSEYLVFTREF